MHKRKIFNRLVWINAIAMLLVGCSTKDRKDTLFGDDLPTIQDVYQQQLGKDITDRSNNLRPIHDKHGDLRGDSLMTYRQIRQQFPVLPNPEMLLYVYPHLTPAGTPVPGYYTVFPFYREDQYALPSDGFMVPNKAIAQ